MLQAAAPKAPNVFITDELDRRVSGKIDSLKEKIALQELAALMASNPEQVLPKFVSLAMEMAGGVSAGLSLLEGTPSPGVFRWHHLKGTLERFAGATTPRNYSPCGIVLDLNAPVLTAHSELAYDWLAENGVALPEVLLVPLHIGSKEPTGTLWIVSDEDGHFNREHARVIVELASFVALALQMVRTEQQLKKALDEQSVLAREISHRIKNLFAITDGMIRFSAKNTTSTTEMAALLSGRLHALADAHALVRQEFSEIGTVAPTADLKELIQKIASPHEHLTSESAGRFSIDGPPTRCSEQATNAVALVFHELATNAAKYGSLTLEEGRVAIKWHRENKNLIFEWRERCGPPVEEPAKSSGFGGEMIRRMVAQMGGAISYDWQPTGLIAKITFPANAIVWPHSR
jgi:two-component sensor histidine kinase